MLIRVVKMTFKADAGDAFKELFDERKEKIRGFEGCLHLELWQDNTHTNLFFTYSHWQSEAALSRYRNSAFFKDTWQRTRLLLAAKAEAWSVDKVAVVL